MMKYITSQPPINKFIILFILFLFSLFGSRYVIDNWIIKNDSVKTAIYWQEAVLVMSRTNISLESIQGINATRLTLFNYKTRFYMELFLDDEEQKNILSSNIVKSGWEPVSDVKYIKVRDNLKLYLTVENKDSKHIIIFIGSY